MPIIVNPYRYITGGGGPPPDPVIPSASFLGSSSSTTDASSYSFSAFDIGTEHAQRIVVVGVIVRDTDSDNRITGVTIGGSAATRAIDTSSAGGVGNMRLAGIYYRAIPTGLTAAAGVSLNNSANACAIARWVIYPTSTTPVDAVEAESGSGATAGALDLATTAGGFALAVTAHNSSTATTWAWTGSESVTEDLDLALGGSARWSAASFLVTVSSTTNDLTASWSGGANHCIAAASWGP